MVMFFFTAGSGEQYPINSDKITYVAEYSAERAVRDFVKDYLREHRIYGIDVKALSDGELSRVPTVIRELAAGLPVSRNLNHGRLQEAHFKEIEEMIEVFTKIKCIINLDDAQGTYVYSRDLKEEVARRFNEALKDAAPASPNKNGQGLRRLFSP